MSRLQLLFALRAGARMDTCTFRKRLRSGLHRSASLRWRSCSTPGRLTLRILVDSGADVELVHINEPSAIESTSYLLKFDSVHGEGHAPRIGPWGLAMWSLPMGPIGPIPPWARLARAVPELSWPVLIFAGQWKSEVDVVDGKIRITKTDGTVINVGYSDASSPAEVSRPLMNPKPPASGDAGSTGAGLGTAAQLSVRAWETWRRNRCASLQVDWAAIGVDLVLECSGQFLTRRALHPCRAQQAPSSRQISLAPAPPPPLPASATQGAAAALLRPRRQEGRCLGPGQGPQPGAQHRGRLQRGKHGSTPCCKHSAAAHRSPAAGRQRLASAAAG